MHKGVGLVAAAAGLIAVASTLSGCELPPVCGAFAKTLDECVELNHAPTVRLRVSQLGHFPAPVVGQNVYLEASGSDQDHDRLYYEWDLNADGRFETVGGQEMYFSGETLSVFGRRITRVYRTPGPRRVTVRVTDYPQLAGGEGSATATVDFRVFSAAEAERDPPHASFTTAVSGNTVQFDASASADPGGSQIIRYEWDLNGDLFVDLVDGDPLTSWTFSSAGEHTVSLKVTNEQGVPSWWTKRIVTTSGDCRPPQCGGSAHAAKPQAPTLPFSARVSGKTLRAKLLDLPGRASWAERTLRRFLKAALRPKLKVSGARSSGIAVAKGRRGALACLRVTYLIEAGKTPTGSLTVIGGTKAAARLRANATFRFGGGSRGSALGLGTVRASRGKPRPLTRACAKLARVRRG